MAGSPPRDGDPGDDLAIDVDEAAHDPFAAPPERDQALALEIPVTPSFAPEPSSAPPPPAPIAPAPTATAAPLPDAPPAAAPPPPVDNYERVRRTPALRIGIGVVLGLAAGWLLSTPYARRAERQIADVRAQADAIRYASDPAARAQVAALDQLASERSSSAALHTGLLWLAIGGAAAGAWIWITRPRGA